MKRIIILNTSQFGSLTDSYKWCEYLRKYYQITFISFNNHWKRMDIEGVNYVYVRRFNNPLIRGLWYLIFVYFYCLFHRAPIFIVYFRYCSILKKLLPWKRMNVDIRTLTVNENSGYNAIMDEIIRNEIVCFDSISFISKGVKNKLNVSCSNQFILPLGSDVISNSIKNWDNIKLLYVGILSHRDILKSVVGFHNYINKYGKYGITYDIVGEGDELSIIKEYIEKNDLKDVIFIHGKIPYDELKPFFEKCNVGVSFIPIEDCYQFQPPTKTFEYILSGLFCIATSTSANKEIINAENGLLINDSSDEFMKSLEYIRENKNRFSSTLIKNTLESCYSWNTIVQHNLIPIIDNLYK